MVAFLNTHCVCLPDHDL